MYTVGTVALTTTSLPSWSAPARCARGSGEGLRVAEVVSALSHALDLSTGQPIGHSVRTCILGMRIAAEVDLPIEVKNDLYYALLLKDCGCSGNASKVFHALGSDDLKAKRNVKTTDWTRVGWESLQYALSHVAPGKPFLERSRKLFALALNQKRHAKATTKIRCERGATLARLMGLSSTTADGILSLDEHWDGSGNPDGLRRTEISILSRIMLLAQTLEVFFASQGGCAALEVAKRRSNKWFDPDLVRAAESLAARSELWADIESPEAFTVSLELEPLQKTMENGDVTLDSICLAFANIVDAKSPFTFNHSNGVANAAVAIARTLGLSRERTLFVRHAALLHDLGKLGVSNEILEKPGKLTPDEWAMLRLHPFYTWKILHGISTFEEMSEVAASHHEKLDGKGYFRGLTGEQLTLESRILAVADIFDALSARRPYRDALPLEKVFEIMRHEAPHAIDAMCLQALEGSGAEGDQTFVGLKKLSEQLAPHQSQSV
jgi:HD-GYP domain-containing protein (c-di-GMP phosphodiesterase class II)